MAAGVGILGVSGQPQREFQSLAAYHGFQGAIGVLMRSGNSGTEVTYVDGDRKVVTTPHELEVAR